MNADCKGGMKMNTDEDKQSLNGITEQVIGCAYKVAKVLGCGFLEKVYENALAIEMRRNGLHVKQQHPMEVFYDGESVGQYVADMSVNDRILIELKAVKAFEDIHTAQCLNYLSATGLHLCLLINFGKPRVEIRRLVKDF